MTYFIIYLIGVIIVLYIVICNYYSDYKNGIDITLDQILIAITIIIASWVTIFWVLLDKSDKLESISNKVIIKGKQNK